MEEKQSDYGDLPRMGRRAFLASTAFAAAGLTAHGADRLAESAARVEAIVQAAGDAPKRANGRPNILVITTDQQWGGAMGCAGNPYVRTPAMDSLAANGVQFEAAYTPNPICVPARTSYMTGTSSHENGVITNMRPGQVDVTAPCLAKHFRDHGYDTGHVGKWHIPRPIDDTDWSGFSYINSARNNGVDFNIPEHCAEFMLQPRENPFFLIASFVNPHDICEWARRLSGLEQTLPNGEIGPPPPPGECPPLPPNRAIPEGEPDVIRQHQFDPNMTSAYPTRDWAPDDPRWRQYLWGYYRMTELVDAYIGQVLAVLRDVGLEENTAIVFSSDHGDGLGAHRWNQKTLFYDEVARVPFIVSWKGHTRAGLRNRDHLVNLGTDLFPTLFDLAGIPAPEGVRGLSAAPAALGRANASAHPYIVTENNHHSGVGNPTDVHGRMLRSARYKYIRYSQGAPAEQLFDLETDPGETTDLAHTGTAPDALDHHRRLLDDHLAATGDPFPRFRAG